MTRVVAVVPAYDPDASLPDLVADLVPQVDHVVVVDDGSREPSTRQRLDALSAPEVTLLRHDGNRGIAAALNTGVEAALAHTPAPDALLTLDQDSRVGPGFVTGLVDAWAHAKDAGLVVGLVAPERVSGLPSQTRSHRDGVALGRDPIQSGVLLPAETWHAVGGFDESLFIDGVDADYALRCLDAGLAVVVADGVTLEHRLGGRHEVSLGRRRVAVTRPATFRYYYLARNRSVLVRRYARRHPGWAAGQAMGLVGHLAVTLVLVPERRERARETWRGLRDASRAVTGRRPEAGPPQDPTDDPDNGAGTATSRRRT